MRTVLVFLMVLSLGATGCGEKKTAGEPPITLGLGPGESAAYETTDSTSSADVTSTTAASDLPPTTPVSPEPALTVTTPSSTEATAAIPRMYTVRRGDTLIGLARRFYNDQNRWKDIWNANRSVIADPNRIMPGWEIRLP